MLRPNPRQKKTCVSVKWFILRSCVLYATATCRLFGLWPGARTFHVDFLRLDVVLCVCSAAYCCVVFCGFGSLLVECCQTLVPLCRAPIYACCALSHLLLTSLVAAPSQLALSDLVCAPLSQLAMFTLAHISVLQACATFSHNLLPFVATGSSSR